MPRPKKTEKDEDYLKKQKQQSRTQEAALTNSFLDILISDYSFEMRYSRTKGATKTVKMIVPTKLIDGEKIYSKEDIMDLSKEICTTEELPPTATLKQKKRNEEAKLANGILALLKQRNFSYKEKKTRPCHKTTRLVRVSILIFPDGAQCNAKQLIEKGTKFGLAVESLMKQKEETINFLNLKKSKESYSDIKKILVEDQSKHRQSDTVDDYGQQDEELNFSINSGDIPSATKNQFRVTANGTVDCVHDFNGYNENGVVEFVHNFNNFNENGETKEIRIDETPANLEVNQQICDNGTIEAQEDLANEDDDTTVTEDNPPSHIYRNDSNPTVFAFGHPSTDVAQSGFISK